MRDREQYTILDCYELIKEYTVKKIDTVNVSSSNGHMTSFLAIVGNSK